LTDPAAKVFGIGFCAHASEQSTFQFLPWLWQAGGSINKLDAPESIEALQYWTDLVQKGYASKDVINQQQNDVMNSFMAGNYAMAVGGPWELPRIQKDAKFDWRVTTLPVKDGKNIQASSLGGFHFAIPKGAKEVDGAFRAIEFLSTPAIFQDGWKSGLMAPRSDVEIRTRLAEGLCGVSRTGQYAIQRGPHPQWPDLSRPIQIAIRRRSPAPSRRRRR
jgi:multiple sugar transport system substrate-binding protein